MDARTAVVTGGTAGIGRAATRGLAERGHRVVVVGRNCWSTPTAAVRIGIGVARSLSGCCCWSWC